VQHHEFTGRTAPHGRQRAAHALVDRTPAEREQGSDRKRREESATAASRPLLPPVSARMADHERAGADEHQIELRIDEGQFRPQQYGANGNPRPPLHVPAASLRPRSLPLHRAEEVRVGLGVLHLVEQESIAASSSIGCRSLRRIHILESSDGSVMSSSLRVPERLMLIDGKVRFSEMRRSKWISELPVPLNSSK